MPISQQELIRIVQPHGIIEGHKEHSHAVPTYKDSHYLTEMAQTSLAFPTILCYANNEQTVSHHRRNTT